MMEDEITISREEYKRLIKTEKMFEQLKIYIVRNINNTQIIKALTVITGKNFFDLSSEVKEGR